MFSLKAEQLEIRGRGAMRSLSGKGQDKYKPRVEGAYHFQQTEGGLSGQCCVGSGRGQEDEPGG